MRAGMSARSLAGAVLTMQRRWKQSFAGPMAFHADSSEQLGLSDIGFSASMGFRSASTPPRQPTRSPQSTPTHSIKEFHFVLLLPSNLG